ncbi:MAG: ABC transporter substrate-binding protein [Desulfobacterales bacterium]|nr:ABC transporter substrate-binding protein [Desulfobacterales bacterium]
MRKHSLLITAAVVFSLLVLFMSAPSYGGEVRGVTDKAITIGIIMPMTGPIAPLEGALALAGGSRNYFRYLNEKGGINGRKIDPIIHDCRFAIPGAIAGFKKLIYRDNAFAIFLPGTGQTLALTPQILKEKVPTITASLSETVITPVEKKRYIFIPCASYQDQITILIDYIMKDLKAKDPRIAFVTLEIEYGKVGLAAARERLKHYGLDLVNVEIMSVGAVDATTTILNINRAKADYVIVHLDMTTSIAFIRETKKYKMGARMLGDYYSCDEDIVRAVGSAAKDYIGSHTFNSWYDETPGIAELRKVTLKYEPGDPKMRNRYYIQGWVMSMIFAEAMKRAGKDLTSENMVEAMESLKEFDTNGLSAPITYTPTNHKAGEYCRLFKADVEKSRMVPISGWVKVAK